MFILLAGGLVSYWLVELNPEKHESEIMQEQRDSDERSAIDPPGITAEEQIRLDFQNWYRVLHAFLEANGRFPGGYEVDPESEIRRAGVTASDVYAPRELWIDRQSRSYQTRFNEIRLDGTPKAAKPMPGSRDIWLQWRFGRWSTGRLDRVMILWSDGTIDIRHEEDAYVATSTLRSLDQRRIDEAERMRFKPNPGSRAFHFVWPDEAGFPGYVLATRTSYEEHLRRQQALYQGLRGR